MNSQVLALVVVGAVCASGTGVAHAQDVVVSAASSLATVLEEISERFELATGDRVALNLAGSNTLARQIQAGARVDVFISADEAQLNAVSRWEVSGTRVELLSNVLAVAVPDDRPERLRTIGDLLEPRFRRIAIGDPAAVPAGVYARAMLTRAGLWTSLVDRLVPTSNVRLALAAVESGAVDAAIVYRSDLVIADRAVEALVVPMAQVPRIVYPVALMREGRNPVGGRRFHAFLTSEEATGLFRNAGFIPLAGEQSQ